MHRESDRIFDEYLVAAARTGNSQAFERLVKRFQPRLIAHAWRLTGDTEMAREAAQDAWVEIVRGLKGLKDTAAFPAWAYRIVTRCCARGIKHRQRQRLAKAAVEAAPPDSTAPSPDPGHHGEANAAKAALASLPADHRVTMALFYLEDFSIAEIAVALAIPPGTVKTRLMHARRKVRAILQGEDNA